MPLFLLLFIMAGVEGLEPPAPGFGDRYFRVMQGKLVAFVLNTAHRLPSIPTQKLEQTGTISCNDPSCCFCQLHRIPSEAVYCLGI